MRGLLASLLLAAALGGCGGSLPPHERHFGPLPVAAGGSYRVLEPPPGAGPGPFPVVYFLHDFWGGDGILWRHGVAQRLAAAVAAGELPPFLLVAPEGGRAFWADSHDGARRYESWLLDELPRRIAERYPVRPGPAGRAVVGISMGGHGAIRLALRRPHEVGAAAALSGLVPPLDWGLVEDTNPLLRLMLKRAFGPSRQDNSLRRNDLYRMMPALYAIPAERRPRLLVRAGTEDKYRFDEASYLFAMVARDNGVAVELVLEPGGHDWEYWSRSTGEVVAWALRALEERANS